MESKNSPRLPRTLLEAVRHFADADVCREFMVSLRWPNGVTCPACGRADVRFIATRKLWECKDKHPRKQFSIKVGTIFEDSPLGMDKWLPVVWLIANCKNGISSYEVARDLGVTQKTAWFMLQRVRVAMETGTFQKIAGEVEVDETFIGGLAKNMHKKVREAKIHGTGPTDKTAVLGVLQRDGEVRAFVVENRKKKTLQAKVRENVEPGSEVFTDTLRSYEGLSPEYAHEAVNHAERYVEGNVHTNGLENFWSLLKRSLGGTYVAVAPFHLHRYVNEQVFRYNPRQGTDGGRFLAVAANTVGRRLTYKELIAADGDVQKEE
ncbi:MAG TPA: IS1595 family transposase [Thermoanaerobaculia bacterium]|jgi:transposase-like protein|nr:IS1595 family transposase [Thermoanaerobaculia bacterium]